MNEGEVDERFVINVVAVLAVCLMTLLPVAIFSMVEHATGWHRLWLLPLSIAELWCCIATFNSIKESIV